MPYEKVGKNDPVCIADEVPFEIPASWMWVRLKNITNVVSARRVHQSDWKTEGIPFYRAREIGALSEYGQIKNDLKEYRTSGFGPYRVITRRVPLK